jgi:hypothetical protein
MHREQLLDLVEGFIPLVPASAVEVKAMFGWFDAELDAMVRYIFILLREGTSAAALALALPAVWMGCVSRVCRHMISYFYCAN